MLPLLIEILDGLSEPGPAAPATPNAVKNLVEARPLGESLEFPGEVLLERLATLLGSPVQSDVDCFRDVSHQKIWHAFIMQALGRF